MAVINGRRALNDAIREEMERDETIFVAGEDVASQIGGSFGVTRDLVKLFGEWRVRDTPISEEAIAGLAVGAAAAGLRPIVEIMFMDFMTIAMDQIANQMAKLKYMYGEQIKLPIVVRTGFGGGFRAGVHHSQSLEAWFLHIPGLKVVAPSCPYDAKGLLKASVRDNNPVIFMEHKLFLPLRGEVPEGDYIVPLGKADIKRQGSDVTVVAMGYTVQLVLSAAEKVAGDGISVEVVDLRTLSPLDEDTIVNSVKKTGRLVVVHEAPKPCGFGAEVAAIVAEKAIDSLEAPVKRLTPPFTPIPYGSVEDYYFPNEESIIRTIRETMS